MLSTAFSKSGARMPFTAAEEVSFEVLRHRYAEENDDISTEVIHAAVQPPLVEVGAKHLELAPVAYVLSQDRADDESGGDEEDGGSEDELVEALEWADVHEGASFGT